MPPFEYYKVTLVTPSGKEINSEGTHFASMSAGETFDSVEISSAEVHNDPSGLHMTIRLKRS